MPCDSRVSAGHPTSVDGLFPFDTMPRMHISRKPSSLSARAKRISLRGRMFRIRHRDSLGQNELPQTPND